MLQLYIIAGPNGAGKTTAAKVLLPEFLGCCEFVNADEVARGLSPLNPSSVDIQAGKLMLKRIKELAGGKVDFAFETTLASRMFARLIPGWKKSGYRVRLIYLWVESVELAMARIAKRVAQGGHNIEDEVVTRRYHAGLKNLFKLYLPLVDNCRIYDNSWAKPRLIAEIEKGNMAIHQQTIWKKVQSYGQK